MSTRSSSGFGAADAAGLRNISGFCTADTARTRCISRFCAADASRLAVIRGSLLRILPVLGSVSGFCAVSTASTASISSVGTASAANTHGKLRPSVHRLDNAIPIFLQETFTDGPTSGSWRNLLLSGRTGVEY